MKRLNDFKALSDLESHTLALNYTYFSLRDTIQQICNFNAHPAFQKGINIKCIIHPSIPDRLHGDQDKFQQILHQILDNAVKYTDQGFISIRVSPQNETHQHLTLRVEIADTGSGIPENISYRLFRSFTSDSSVRPLQMRQNSGLGLRISRHLVELMGGQLSFDSQEGRGSTFSFTAVLRKPVGEVA